MSTVLEVDEFLEHHGIKGQKWGVRRSREVLSGGRKSPRTKEQVEARAKSNKQLKTDVKTALARGAYAGGYTGLVVGSVVPAFAIPAGLSVGSAATLASLEGSRKKYSKESQSELAKIAKEQRTTGKKYVEDPTKGTLNVSLEEAQRRQKLIKYGEIGVGVALAAGLTYYRLKLVKVQQQIF